MTDPASPNSNSNDSLVEELVVAGAVTVRVVTFPAGRPADGQQLGQFVQATAAANDGSNHILLDMEHVHAIKGPFLGELLKLMKQLRGAGGSLKLCRLQQPIHDVMRVTRMEKLFECFADREAALASVAAAHPAG